jgi:hypothetical protein
MATPQEALTRACERWNAGDLTGYLSLYDEGIALHGYSPEPMDKSQVRAFYEGIFSAFGTPQLNSTRFCGTAARAPSGSP